MFTSEAIDLISAALVKAQAHIKPAPKDAKNPHFKSRYADLASVMEACREVLAQNALAVIQAPYVVAGKVIVETRIQHKSGQFFASELALIPKAMDPQSVGSCITYGRRYGLQAMVGVVAEEDDDGNAATFSPAAKEEFKPFK